MLWPRCLLPSLYWWALKQRSWVTCSPFVLFVNEMGFKHRSVWLQSMCSSHRVWKTASQQTCSLLLASRLRNISSCLSLLSEAGIRLQNGLSFLPLKQRFLFNQLFSLEHLQGIPSTETLGDWEPATSGQKDEIFLKCALWNGGNGRFLFIAQVNPGSLGFGLFSITPHNGTSVSERQGWPSMPRLQASSGDTAPGGPLHLGMGKVEMSTEQSSSPLLSSFVFTPDFAGQVRGTLKWVWGKEFKATY